MQRTGSSNVLGGTFCVLKTFGRRIDDMLVKEKAAMKCAFGENPKACYQEKSVSCRDDDCSEAAGNAAKDNRI